MKPKTMHPENASREMSVFDTTFVLFFLAVDLGQRFFSSGFDGILSAATLVMLMVLPYFILPEGSKPAFWNWIFGRTLIAMLAVTVGAMFEQALGVVLPESLRHLPLTLLIAAAMVSFYVQFYGVLKLRLAK